MRAKATSSKRSGVFRLLQACGDIQLVYDSTLITGGACQGDASP